MNKRVTQFWFPAFLTLSLSMVLLAVIEIFGPKPWVDSDARRPPASHDSTRSRLRFLAAFSCRSSARWERISPVVPAGDPALFSLRSFFPFSPTSRFS